MIDVSKNINNKSQIIKFWTDPEQSMYIKTKPVHHSQQLLEENEEDGSCIFSVDVVVNIEMYSVFMSYGPGIRIIYPRSVVKKMKEKMLKAAALYDKKQNNSILKHQNLLFPQGILWDKEKDDYRTFGENATPSVIRRITDTYRKEKEENPCGNSSSVNEVI